MAVVICEQWEQSAVIHDVIGHGAKSQNHKVRGQPIRFIQDSGERPFTQLTHDLCLLFIPKSIAKLRLLSLPQVDSLESLALVGNEAPLVQNPLRC